MNQDRPRFWSFPKGAGWVLGGVVLGSFIALQVLDLVLVKVNQPRLDALYAMRRELRLGMPRAEVLNVLKRYTTPDVDQHVFENGDITLWVHYGAVDSCSLAIGFKAGALEIARTVGEDGPQDKCPSAPPDLR